MRLGPVGLGRPVFTCLVLLPVLAAGALPSGPAEQVRSFNEQLAGSGAGLRTRTATASNTLSLVRARAEAFQELIRTNPAQAVSLALPAETRAKLAAVPEAAAYLEAAGTWTGRAQSLVEDDFQPGRARTVHRLDTGAETLEVHYASEPPAAGCAQSVEVQGVRLGNAVAALTAAAGEANASDAAAATCSSAAGDRRVAVILLSFPSTPLPANVTPSVVQNAFFGSGRSLDGFWREASYGKTSASGSVFGPFALPADYPCTDTGNIMKEGMAAAQGSLTFRDYTHLYFLFPKNGSCAVGTGSVGCWQRSSPQGTITSAFVWMPVTSQSSTDELAAIAVHEGGHNLGLQHSGSIDYGAETLGAPGSAGTFEEYGDRYSAMGVTWSVNNNFGYGHYAAPQKLQLGWLQDRANLETVETSGSHTVYPYEPENAGVQALRIRRGTGGTSWLWLEFRQPAGDYDPNFRFYSQSVFRGALVRFEDPLDTARKGYTKLLDFHPTGTPNNFNDAQLTAGQTWTDAYSDLSLRVDSATADALSVTVSYGTAGAGPQLAASARSAADGSASVAPGGIVSIYGDGLAPGLQQALTYPLPQALSGTSVEVVAGGTVHTAPLYFVSPKQINAQLPYNVTTAAQIRVRTASGASVALDLQPQPSAPRLFTSDMSGKGTVAALRWPDYKVIGGATAVRPGDTVMVYATGLGSVSPPIAAGAAAGGGNICDQAVQATIGGLNARVLWAGLAPGFSGLYQINLQVPAGAAAGARSIFISAGGAASQAEVTLPVTR